MQEFIFSTVSSLMLVLLGVLTLGKRAPYLSFCYIDNVKGIMNFSVLISAIVYFLQRRNFTLAFKAAESLGIASILVSV